MRFFKPSRIKIILTIIFSSVIFLIRSFFETSVGNICIPDLATRESVQIDKVLHYIYLVATKGYWFCPPNSSSYALASVLVVFGQTVSIILFSYFISCIIIGFNRMMK